MKPKRKGVAAMLDRKVSDKAQRQRFIEAAREAGASEDEAVFRENLKRVAKAKLPPKPQNEPDTT
jgi:hypothetical protein